MLTGRSDSKLVNHWNPQLPKFSGTGPEYHGAYGRRLRSSFGLDQVQRAIDSFEHNPITRQVVLQIWNPELDAPQENGLPRSHDIPCNVSSLLKVRDNQLYWLQILRSNDLLRGTPYNLIQFTVLQEFIAGCLGLDLGQYTQVSDSLHVYVSDLPSFTAHRGTQQGAKTSAVLSLPRRDAFDALAAMERALERLADSTTYKEFERSLDSSLPPGHADLFMIAAADSARRRNWSELQAEAARRCQDVALTELWRAWEGRNNSQVRPRIQA
jgi:thymidylate synthase